MKTLYALPLLLHGSLTHQRLWLAKVLKNEFGMASKAPLSMQMPYLIQQFMQHSTRQRY